MKNLAKTLVIVIAISLYSISAFAANTVVCDTVVKDTTKKDVEVVLAMLTTNEYETVVEVASVPQVIVNAIAEKYADYTIEEARHNEAKEYKLVLKKDDDKKTVYYTEGGEFVKEDGEGETQEA